MARKPTDKRAAPAAPLVIKNPPPSAEQQARTAQSNSSFLNALADKLERHDVLSDWEFDYAAGALRGMAVRMLTETPTNPEGRPQLLDPGSTAIEFAILLRRQVDRGERLNQSKATREIAEKYSVSERTVKDTMAPMLEAALRQLRVTLPVRKKRL